MKMKYTLQYVISSLFLLCCLLTEAQENTKVTDSLKFSQKHGLRVGADVSKLLRTTIDNQYKGFEINADFRLTEKLYIAGELGNEKKDTETDFINVTASGNYTKLGVDYNMYTNWLDMNNMIYSGFRAGFSSFSQTLNSYSVYNQNQFWSPQLTNTDSDKSSNLTATWLEYIIGIKAEVFNNLFIGINVQLKQRIAVKNPDRFENLYIPGFGKTYDGKKLGVGYGYSVSYLIPLFKKNGK